MFYLVPARDWRSGIRHRWWCFEIRTNRCAQWRRNFEADPSFLLCGQTFPGFVIIDEETILMKELEDNANNFFETVGCVTGGGIVTAISNPVEKGFNRLVYIVRGAEDSVLNIHGGDVGVGGVQVIYDGTGGGEAVFDVLVLEGVDEYFVNSREKNFSKSLVGAIALVEECGGGVESIAKFGDLGDSGVGWDDGYRSVVDGHNECGGQQGVVNGR